MREPKVVHILANGKRVKSVKGHVIPADNPVYEIILGTQQKEGEKHGQWEKEIV